MAFEKNHTVDDLYVQSVRCFSFKFTRNMLPSRMLSLGNKIDHSHNTRGAKNNLIVNSSDHRSLQYVFPKHWNSLSTSLKESPSISSFKINSKRDLLAPYSAFKCTTPSCRLCQPALPDPLRN